jgi:hypothetical protein
MDEIGLSKKVRARGSDYVASRWSLAWSHPINHFILLRQHACWHERVTFTWLCTLFWFLNTHQFRHEDCCRLHKSMFFFVHGPRDVASHFRYVKEGICTKAELMQSTPRSNEIFCLLQPNPMAASVEISLFKSADAGKSKEVEKDSFIRLKNVERKLQFLQIQEDYIKDEVKNLKRELLRAQEEVRSIYALVN